MAFHKSKLGRFGQYLPCDVAGRVPEEGDSREDFVFAAPVTEEQFQSFKAKAIEETAAIRAEIKKQNG